MKVKDGSARFQTLLCLKASARSAGCCDDAGRRGCKLGCIIVALCIKFSCRAAVLTKFGISGLARSWIAMSCRKQGRVGSGFHIWKL